MCDRQESAANGDWSKPGDGPVKPQCPRTLHAYLSAAPAKGTLGPPDAAPAEDETCAPVPPLTMPVKDAASVSGIEESLGENADGAIKGHIGKAQCRTGKAHYHTGQCTAI